MASDERAQDKAYKLAALTLEANKQGAAQIQHAWVSAARSFKGTCSTSSPSVPAPPVVNLLAPGTYVAKLREGMEFFMKNNTDLPPEGTSLNELISIAISENCLDNEHIKSEVLSIDNGPLYQAHRLVGNRQFGS